MELRNETTRRRLLTLGAVGLGVLVAGDRVEAGVRPRPQPRARAALGPPAATPVPSAAPSRPPAQPPPEALRPRTEPIYRLHDLHPGSPADAIALTIDDGPHPEYTPRMLDLLAKHDVKATFSLIGIQVREFPKLAARIVDAGHELCNHTMHHPLYIAEYSAHRVAAEIGEAHDRISQATGVEPRFFRSPGGAWSKAIFHESAKRGLQPIDWDIDPRDWARPGTRKIRRAMLKANGGDILLCHDGGGDRSETLAALATVLPKLQKRGLQFVRL